MERKYFDIDEKLAKNALGMWSFGTYKENSTTEDYKKAVDNVYLIVEKVANERPEHAAEAETLAERYARKYAEWINKKHSIDMMCPSVMICGAGNFPTQKKEKQNARTDKHWEEYGYIKAIPKKIKNLLYGETIIKSGDANAVEKLQQKLEELEALQNGMKKANAYYKEKGTLEGFTDLKQSTIDAVTEYMKNDWYGNKPFPSYTLTNNNAKIKATKARLDNLIKVKEQGTKEQTATTEEGNDIFKVVENVEIMRLQLLFDGKPDKDTRNILKKNGFKWSPKNEAWQRQLTNNARYSLKRVVEQLKTA